MAADSTAQEADFMVAAGSTVAVEAAGFTEAVEDSMVGNR